MSKGANTSDNPLEPFMIAMRNKDVAAFGWIFPGRALIAWTVG